MPYNCFEHLYLSICLLLYGNVISFLLSLSTIPLENAFYYNYGGIMELTDIHNISLYVMLSQVFHYRLAMNYSKMNGRMCQPN